MFGLFVLFAVLMLMLAGIAALLYAILPERWQHTLARGPRGLEDLRGDLRRACGRWKIDDIERHTIKAVEHRAQITLNQAFLPNRIDVKISTADACRFTALLPVIQADLAERIKSLAGKPVRGSNTLQFSFVGKLTLTLVPHRDVAPGTLRVTTAFSADTLFAPDRSTPSHPDRSSAPRWLFGNTVVGVHELRQRTLIGRDKACELRLAERRVSNRHAMLSRDEHGVLLEDLNSTNGTRVNGKSLTAPMRLSSGDVVSFGGSPALRLVCDRPTVSC
jgi:FHA domain